MKLAPQTSQTRSLRGFACEGMAAIEHAREQNFGGVAVFGFALRVNASPHVGHVASIITVRRLPYGAGRIFRHERQVPFPAGSDPLPVNIGAPHTEQGNVLGIDFSPGMRKARHLGCRAFLPAGISGRRIRLFVAGHHSRVTHGDSGSGSALRCAMPLTAPALRLQVACAMPL